MADMDLLVRDKEFKYNAQVTHSQPLQKSSVQKEIEEGDEKDKTKKRSSASIFKKAQRDNPDKEIELD